MKQNVGRDGNGTQNKTSCCFSKMGGRLKSKKGSHGLYHTPASHSLYHTPASTQPLSHTCSTQLLSHSCFQTAFITLLLHTTFITDLLPHSLYHTPASKHHTSAYRSYRRKLCRYHSYQEMKKYH